MEIIKQKVQQLNKYGERIPPIMNLSKKANVEPGYILAAGIALSCLLILIFLGGTILTAVVTVVYPAFKSIKALETKDDEDDDKVWLTYWTVFGIFTLLDEFAFFILNLIPFYFYIRLLFFIWMMAPQTQGAQTLYKSIVRPLLRQHKDKIEKIIAEVKGSAVSVAKEAHKQAMEEISKPENMLRAANAVNTAQNTASQFNRDHNE